MAFLIPQPTGLHTARSVKPRYVPYSNADKTVCHAVTRTCPASHGGPHGLLTLQVGAQPRVVGVGDAVPGPVPLRESKHVLLYLGTVCKMEE